MMNISNYEPPLCVISSSFSYFLFQHFVASHRTVYVPVNNNSKVLMSSQVKHVLNIAAGNNIRGARHSRDYNNSNRSRGKRGAV